jgi:hypothetical protein
MPYPGVPSSLTKKMEDCVRQVKAKGGVKNPYAVCHASIMGKKKKKDSDANRKALMKVKKRK